MHTTWVNINSPKLETLDYSLNLTRKKKKKGRGALCFYFTDSSTLKSSQDCWAWGLTPLIPALEGR